MISLLPVLAAATMAAAQPSVVYTQIPADLRAASETFDRAQLENDRAALEQVVADDFTLVSGSARLQAKAAFIADFTAPGFKLDPFVIREPVEKV